MAREPGEMIDVTRAVVIPTDGRSPALTHEQILEQLCPDGDHRKEAEEIVQRSLDLGVILRYEGPEAPVPLYFSTIFGLWVQAFNPN